MCPKYPDESEKVRESRVRFVYNNQSKYGIDKCIMYSMMYKNVKKYDCKYPDNCMDIIENEFDK